MIRVQISAASTVMASTTIFLESVSVKNKSDKFDPDLGHLVPRSQPPRNLNVPQFLELAPNFMLGKDPNVTIVGCFSCHKPLFEIRILRDTYPIATEMVPLGDYKVPKADENDCPLCRANYRRWDDQAKLFKYFSNKGIL